jgi:hypothetical protein
MKLTFSRKQGLRRKSSLRSRESILFNSERLFVSSWNL